ncbi:MAG: BREX system Lon protease-like protein BrxL [Prevotellaceae bacterium]|nr:BREX system Lon protease-like protein BrxL [Prevotellaceae bacterium]
MGKVVRKDLAFLVRGNLPVPTYVLEYLLGQYCASEDEQVIAEGIEKVKTVIRNNYINRAEADIIKGRIRERGSYTVIDKVTAMLNDKQDQYEVSFANLGLVKIPIGDAVIRRNPKLLSGNGVWSIVKINYLQGEDVRMRWEIQSLKPIQISSVDIDEYVKQRKEFTTDEWMDFLIHTVGLNPEPLNRREKFIVLARLLPHVENNFNLVELGPKGTGKSHVYQEFSPYSVLVSGGDVSSARLFVKMSGNKELLGLVGYWDVVAWDEYEQKPHRSIEAKLVDTMQNYLANKSFNRGKATHEATASMVFVGNTKHTVPYMLKNSHLFESIPVDFLQTGAFLDRMHLYNPGWEVKVLKKNSFSTDFGLITDYISAVLHEMRGLDFSGHLATYAKFDGSLSERDHNAIRKTFSGLYKLLYPDGNITAEEAKELIDFAAECRKRVKDQLYIIDSTFRAEPADFVYKWLATGEDVVVETLENIEYNHKLDMEQAVDGGHDVEVTQPQMAVADRMPRPRINRLAAKVVHIRENQSGVCFKNLFGEYLKGAKDIKLVDSYIRLPYQFDNLVEFLQVIVDMNQNGETVKVHVSTDTDSDEKAAEAIDNFNDLVDDLAPLGIALTYDFEAAHDRSITTDTGWYISMGRGLDIYDRINSRYSLARQNPSLRRCKSCDIQFNRAADVINPGNHEGGEPNDTLYLTIKQEYFDEIMAGNKVEEFREIKDTTWKRYCDGLNPDCTTAGEEYDFFSYNNGRFPFLPKRYKYLKLAVGYNKDRDWAIVETDGTRFILEESKPEENIGIWVIAYHIGNIVEVHKNK